MKKDFRFKRFTRKGAIYTLIAEEWNDGTYRFQRMRQVPKGKQMFGNVIIYGISPLDKSESQWDFNELTKYSTFVEHFYIDYKLSYSEKTKKRKEFCLE